MNTKPLTVSTSLIQITIKTIPLISLNQQLHPKSQNPRVEKALILDINQKVGFTPNSDSLSSDTIRKLGFLCEIRKLKGKGKKLRLREGKDVKKILPLKKLKI